MASESWNINRIAPWRFLLFFAVLILATIAATSAGAALSRGLLIGFDSAAVAFLASYSPTFSYDAKRIRMEAARNDANRVVLLILSFLLTVIVLAVLVGELAQGGAISAIDKIIVTVSLVLVWTFGNAVYALHYAHLYYTSDDGGRDCAGLEFPKLREPLMADFAYFAFTLGVAVQTSDVAITSPHIRKVVTAHCVVGFFFNLGVLALTVNVLGSR
jgi:uncharacterized membrane protein